jgi:serine protein kinase
MGENSIISRIQELQNTDDFQNLHWQGSFEDYLNIVRENPKVTRSAFERVYDMILTYGTEEFEDNKQHLVRYKFFDDPAGHGRDAIFGLERPLMRMVNIFKSAARRYGTERRVLLLHGPVGCAKSTIVRLMKRGLEIYSRTDEGALYTIAWTSADEGGDGYNRSGDEMICPMHEEPLHLIPMDWREKVLEELNAGRSPEERIYIEGELCPCCRQMYKELISRYRGDWTQVLNHIRVRRVVLSEKDRIGIGTFQPKDEKNQDATELTGDINYRKIAEYGSDSDPRAFNFDGEFNVANRGLVEFIEVLKLDVAFLYDLLGASQEHKIKPKKFPQTDIDEVIIGHTNAPEYKKLQNNEFMEALRDRTVKIDIPYITRLDDEIKIYEKDFNAEKIPHIHIAPHTIKTAAMWAILTRLEEPKKAQLTLLQKLKLYNGQSLPGFTEDNVLELRREGKRKEWRGFPPAISRTRFPMPW